MAYGNDNSDGSALSDEAIKAKLAENMKPWLRWKAENCLTPFRLKSSRRSR